MKFSLLSSYLLIGSADAFTSSPIRHGQQINHLKSPTCLLAAGGPPQYDKFQATLREAEKVGDGSFMLHIDTEDEIEYEPGHVIALEIQADDSVAQDGDSKTSADAKENGGWMRGPYTVSRSTAKSLDVMIRIVGDKSERYSTVESGTPLQFGGKFKVPILEGIATESTKRVVMISTGVGIGPCVGAIEKALEMESFPSIDLIASFQKEGEVAYKEHLDTLQREHPDRFSCKAIITSEQGRLSSSIDNMKAITETAFTSGIEDTHYHLIGNGQMVSEFKAGLEKAGVPDDKVTLEIYFNQKAEMDAEAVDRIAAVMLETAAAAVV